ncbi:MAG: sulfatase [Pseudomonadales bacterium]
MTKLQKFQAVALRATVACIVASGLAITSLAASAAGKQPNIIFIMSDDHAANAISSYGSRLSSVVKTPNIDRLANEGVRLNSMFAANSICTPSRASILTGQYSHTNGVRTLDDVIDPAGDNLAKQLKQAGYNTAIIGKWHLKSEPSGFDYYNVLPGQGRYHNPRLKEMGDSWVDGDVGGKVYKGYVSDVITDLALDWVSQRDADAPFFLMLHHKAPHGLWEPPKRYEDLYADVFIPEPESLYKRGNHGPTDDVIIDGKKGQQFGSSVSRRMEGRGLVTRMLKDRWPTGTLELDTYDKDTVTSAAYQKYLKDYLRTAASVDDSVGKVLDYLDQQGLADNTIVIYTSDQGMLLGEHDYYDKRWIYEESIQMPFLIRYPGVVPKQQTSDALFANIDIAPTLLEFAGQSAPALIQGKSFKTALENPAQAVGDDSLYYRYWLHMAHHYVPAHYGLRTSDYKLVFFYGLALDANGSMPASTPPYWELYDLKNDPREMNNLIKDPAYQKIALDLKEQLMQVKTEVGDDDSQYPELQALAEKGWSL